MAKARGQSATKKVQRSQSWTKCKERKKLVRTAQLAAEKRNRDLRSQGLPTPHEARKEANRARRAELHPKEQSRNERGFIIEADGSLRDPGGWGHPDSKSLRHRRNQRYIHLGR